MMDALLRLVGEFLPLEVLEKWEDQDLRPGVDTVWVECVVRRRG